MILQLGLSKHISLCLLGLREVLPRKDSRGKLDSGTKGKGTCPLLSAPYSRGRCPNYSSSPWQRPLVPLQLVPVSIVFPHSWNQPQLHSLRDKGKAGQCPCLEARSLAPQVPSLCPGRQPPLLKGLCLSSMGPSPKLPKAESYLLPWFFPQYCLSTVYSSKTCLTNFLC